MAFNNWDSETRGLFRRVTSESDPETWQELDSTDKDFVRFMFDLGFVNERVSTPVRVESRNRYFDEMGMDPADFDWNAWRRYMGYSDDSGD